MSQHTFLRADARALPLASASVHAVITSPPYYELRHYDNTRGQIGHGGVDRYVNDLSRVFAECRRVLRDDGVFVLNMGDTYAGKQLLGMPWAVAFRLRADGWLLRSDSIWHKSNGMPDSAQDRPEAQHEYLFVFTKSPKNYWDRYAVDRVDRLSVRKVAVGRSKHAHFASYPPQLVFPYIKQATSDFGCCAHCGAPWVRRVLKTRVPTRPGLARKVDPTGKSRRDPLRHVTKVETTGWAATCACPTWQYGPPETETVACVVLDPFAGACSTAVACEWAGRDSISVDLSAEYLALGPGRVRTERPKTPGRKRAATPAPLPGQLEFPAFAKSI